MSEKLAWAAGFYCGEGSASIRGRQPAVSIGQKNREVLDTFCAAVGMGKVNGPYQYKCVMHYWVLNGRDNTRRLAGLLWPWLSTEKREQFDRVFAAMEAIPAMPQRRNRVQRAAAGLDPEPPGRSPESVARYQAKSNAKVHANRSSPEGRARRREQYRQQREGAVSSQ